MARSPSLPCPQPRGSSRAGHQVTYQGLPAWGLDSWSLHSQQRGRDLRYRRAQPGNGAAAPELGHSRGSCPPWGSGRHRGFSRTEGGPPLPPRSRCPAPAAARVLCRPLPARAGRPMDTGPALQEGGVSAPPSTAQGRTRSGVFCKALTPFPRATWDALSSQGPSRCGHLGQGSTCGVGGGDTRRSGLAPSL